MCLEFVHPVPVGTLTAIADFMLLTSEFQTVDIKVRGQGSIMLNEQ